MKQRLLSVLILSVELVIASTVAGWLGYRAGTAAGRTASRDVAALAAAQIEVAGLQEENRNLTEQVADLRRRVDALSTESLPPPEQLAPALAVAPAEPPVVEVKPAPVPKLKRVTADGDQVELSDGSLWELDPTQTDQVRAWRAGVPISVVSTDELVWNHRLVNREAGETVDVKLLSPAPE
jgi:hypothetical protein